MEPENTSSTEGSAPITPSTPSPSPQAFGDDSAPEWVKTAGLQDAHKAAKPPGAPAAATPPVGGTTPPAAVPAVTPAAAVTPPANPAVDPTAIARAVAEGIRTGNQPAPAGPTQEQLAQQLGIVTVTPELYKSMLGVDAQPEQVAALNEFGQGIAKQAVTIASILFGKQIKELQDQLTPYTQVVRTQEAQRIKGEFYSKHTDLKGYEAMVEQQYNLAKASGKTFASIEDAGKYVADQTRSTLQSLGIKPGTPPPANGPTNLPGKTVPQSRTMTPTMVGGRGGGSNQSTSPKTTNEAVWGS